MTLGKDLLRYQDKSVLIFDTETFSVNMYNSLPWQLSWATAKNGKIKEEFDFYIYWDNINDRISDGAKRVTNFNYGEYEERARPKEEVWEIFESYFNDPEYLLVGHNLIHFDIFQLNNLRRELGLPPDWSYLSRTIDTLALARAYRSQSAAVNHAAGNEFLAWQYRMLDKRMKKCKLSDMAKEFDIKYEDSCLHNAMYDNWLCLQVFEKLKWAVEV